MSVKLDVHTWKFDCDSLISCVNLPQPLRRLGLFETDSINSLPSAKSDLHRDNNSNLSGFPKCNFGFTTAVQHSVPLSTPVTDLHRFCGLCTSREQSVWSVISVKNMQYQLIITSSCQYHSEGSLYHAEGGIILKVVNTFYEGILKIPLE